MSVDQYDINTTDIEAAYAPLSSDVLRTSYINVSSNCAWVYSRPNEEQVVMNPTRGAVYFGFPSNSIVSRSFTVTAANPAVGYNAQEMAVTGSDVEDIVLNLEKVTVQIPSSVFLQIQKTPASYGGSIKYGAPYIIRSIDTNINKTRPGNFLPSSITGGTTATFTWTTPAAQLPPKIFITWNPPSNVDQPVQYVPSGSSTFIKISGFTAFQQYSILFTSEETSTVLAAIQAYPGGFTPTQVSPMGLIIVNQPTGATSVTVSVDVAFVTSVSITWSPATSRPPVKNLPLSVGQNVLVPISGFSPNIEYMFTYVFAENAEGTFQSYTFTQQYVTAYQSVSVVLSLPITYPTENYVRLGWLVTPPTSVTIVAEPQGVNSLSPVLTTTLGPRTSGQAFTLLNNFVIGELYTIKYYFAPSSDGVYGPPLITPTQINVSVRNYPIVTGRIAKGGNIVTLQWSVAPPTEGSIRWLGNTRQFAASQTSMIINDYVFLINTEYIFTFTFNETPTQPVYTDPDLPALRYTTFYEPRTVNINPPKSLSATSVQLSWSYISPKTPISGRIEYNIPDAVGENGVAVPALPIEFTASESSVIVPNLMLGKTYDFVYIFYTDGVYANVVVTPVPYTHKNVPVCIFDPTSGGTTIRLGWQLKVPIDSSGTLQNINEADAIVTWIPRTLFMGNGVDTTANAVDIKGFTVDGVTAYRFNVSFAETALTLAKTFTLPSAYTPVLAVPPLPIISVAAETDQSGVTVLLQFSWVYPYQSAFNLYWDIPTFIQQPLYVEYNSKQAVDIEGFQTDLLYTFTFQFEPDPDGVASGQLYTFPYYVPKNPEYVVSLTSVESQIPGRKSVKVSWTVSPATTVKVEALGPSDADSKVSGVLGASTAASYIFTGLNANTPYIIKTTFFATTHTDQFNNTLTVHNSQEYFTT